MKPDHQCNHQLASSLPLLIPCSSTTTESNKTGSWRFLRPRYDEKTAPCSVGCPAGEDIARIQMLTARGLFKEAWEAILMENPLPAVCGRVCFHPCERVCNRGELDEAVAIHSIERFLADTASRYGWKPDMERLPAQAERIAVVGSGPSGLAAAFFLARLGYRCDVFEALPEPGGLLRWGIPAYRLPADTLKEEIDRIKDLGVSIHCGRTVSEAFMEEARKNYDGLFMGCGLWRGLQLLIPGEDLPGVEEGLGFLQRIRRGDDLRLNGQRVAVIGGGNTAVDVARSVVRLGGRPVIVYRRRCEDMPAFREEIKAAEEEGVEILELLSPRCIEATGEGLLLSLQPMEVIEEETSGRAIVRASSGAAQTLSVNRVFSALGHQAMEPWLEPSYKAGSGAEILRLRRSVMVVDSRGFPTAHGGDSTVDTKSVVHAVASAKEAALALHLFFRKGASGIQAGLDTCRIGSGASLSFEIHLGGARAQRNPHTVTYGEINADYFQFSSRLIQPKRLISERASSFAEIDFRISAGMAVREAGRCFNCGICNQCDNCRLFCPDLAVHREDTARGRSIDYEYCKGCGVCVVECPRNAMLLEEESETA